ncbi:MAG: zinc-ribbon domain-containing protein [Clostridiales bacterium]|nr:zinc-ribbon domain-containing protein [Clostridiales bacterium]
MGLFKKIKKQLLAVIEYKNENRDEIVYRYPLTERDEIMNSSTLVVRESQAAIFVHKGQIADVFTAGTYKLSTENIPFLTKLLSLPTGFNSPIKAEVYFVNLRQFTGLKWGTQNPIMMRDNDFGSIRVRGYGVYSFKVDDAKVFLKEMFGTASSFSVSDVANQLKPVLLSSLSDAIAESKISALDLAANYSEIASKAQECGAKSFTAFGLKICSFVIENLSLPEEVEKALDERTKVGVMEDKVGTYTRLKAADALGDAAKNPSGNNLAGLGVGLSAGSAMGNIFAGNLSGENIEPKSDLVDCVNCGAKIKKRAKFCPECGSKQSLSCPKCGHDLRKNAKFCSECGTKIVKEKAGKTCECGTVLTSKDKFCPNCGKENN